MFVLLERYSLLTYLRSRITGKPHGKLITIHGKNTKLKAVEDPIRQQPPNKNLRSSYGHAGNEVKDSKRK